ncbi:unnamed protein product [Caenorhabditis angaria]|uniref:Potassium channel domain-containing protein n=1 Tax=Caenorhabditis angaria TaxID=860376 RepID=A0A9P1IWB7_9PELO|nr:unnamed protein product [Caenorhabditis angaria]
MILAALSNRNPRMLWNLVAVGYERYNLHHLAKILVLLLYSFFGAAIFILLEADNEKQMKDDETLKILRASLASKTEFIYKIQQLYNETLYGSSFADAKIRRVLSEYDSQMGIKIDNSYTPKWDIWGGLYYSGTIYTTIGYGDLAAVTVLGRIFTMVYAMIGIPMVITILNDWGNMLFHGVNNFWQNSGRKYFHKICQKLRFKKPKNVEETQKRPNQEHQFLGRTTDFEPLVESVSLDGQNGQQPIPLFLAFTVLGFWILLCVGYFAIFEDWTFFESVYFFFVSMTTIGFGDITPNHSVAVGGIIFILGGLSVVSMSINVLQMKLDFLFQKIVQDIENDFKSSLSTASESRKVSIGVSELGSIDPSKKKQMSHEGDIADKYTEGMDGTNKFFMRFMSNHQKKMLNEKFDERAKMRNSATQTTTCIKVASVQTADRYEPQWEDEPEEQHPVSRINTRRLYIYNTGE